MKRIQEWLNYHQCRTGITGDYSQTKFANASRKGYFDDGFVALMKRKGEGVDDWELATLSLGATDAPFVSWAKQFGIPSELVMP